MPTFTYVMSKSLRLFLFSERSEAQGSRMAWVNEGTKWDSESRAHNKMIFRSLSFVRVILRMSHSRMPHILSCLFSCFVLSLFWFGPIF